MAQSGASPHQKLAAAVPVYGSVHRHVHRHVHHHVHRHVRRHMHYCVQDRFQLCVPR